MRSTTACQLLMVISYLWGLLGVWSASGGRWQEELLLLQARRTQTGESHSAQEPYPSPVTAPAPASRIPPTPRACSRAGLPTPQLSGGLCGPTARSAPLPQPPERKGGRAGPPQALPPAQGPRPRRLPYLMKISAMRKPMPEPPPVMNATWPLGEQRDSQGPAPGPGQRRRPRAGEAVPPPTPQAAGPSPGAPS